MPRDYRGGTSAARKTAVRRPRQKVTVTTVPPVVPIPCVPTSSLGAYNDVLRAAYREQGIDRPGLARTLFDSGVHPDDLIRWTGAGIGITEYNRMVTLSSSGLTPQSFTAWTLEGFNDSQAIDMSRAGFTPQQAGIWAAAAHQHPRCLQAAVSVKPNQFTCCCPRLGSGQITSLIKYGKSPGWFTEAAEVGASDGSIVVIIAFLGIPLPIVKIVADKNSVGRADVSRVETEWKKWLTAAGGSVNLAAAVAGSGSPLSTVVAWSKTGLPSERVLALARAGFSPAEAVHPDIRAVTEDQLVVMAALRGIND